MRITAKLLLTYVLLILVVAVAVGLGLPRFVQAQVAAAEHRQLEKVANSLVSRFTKQLEKKPGMPGVNALDEATAAEELWLIVSPQGRVIRAENARLQGKMIPPALIKEAQARPRFLTRRLQQVPEVGAAVVAVAQFDVDPISGYYLLLLRDVAFIQALSRPITIWLMVVIGVVLLVALSVVLYLGSDLVRRIQATGEAARALAEGNLSRRAKVDGSDEITELAGHFNHMAERLESLVDGLRRSERLRKELLVTVSHELRTPMTSIAGFAEALRDGVVRDESQKERYYQIIAGEAQRLNRLINDVFDMAKLEAGQMEIRLQAMPVAAWLMEVAEGFAPVAEGAGCRLELEVSPEAEVARVYGDRDRLDQVLMNLLSNAVRFSPAGAAVTVRATAAKESVTVAVADRGPGLSPEEAGRVFERFWQGENKGKGTPGAGLGLAIVKSLVEAHGGQVGVESVPGQGAAFWFRLKRLES